jgi:cell fate (sporulation/competence/biofilm development) regulator YlbF (YheA/YmcA/DUF963 family)
MNFYDKVHDLVRCLKNTDEYKEYIKLKEQVNADSVLSGKIREFKVKQREQQMKYMSGQQMDEQTRKNMEESYKDIISSELGLKFFQAEIKLDVMLADMQKILAEGMQDIVEL